MKASRHQNEATSRHDGLGGHKHRCRRRGHRWALAVGTCISMVGMSGVARASVLDSATPAPVIREGAPTSLTDSLTGANTGSGSSLSEPLPGSDRMPNGWALHPAGTQVLTNRGTTGVAVSPDGKSIYATTSGIFEEAVVHIDASTLLPTPTLASDTYQGALADAAGNVWVSGGPANAVWQYKAAGPALLDVRRAGVVPDTPNRGIPVTGYPGNMVMAGRWLAVAGNLSVPNSVVASASSGGSCAQSDVCSVINLIDAANPDALSPAVHAVPVGRDAYGLAYRPSRGSAPDTLYVSNFADQTNPSRSGSAGVGTVSVVNLDQATGTGTETQVVPVGMGPAGLAMSPDGRTVVTADSGSDQLSVLDVDPATAGLTPSQVVSVAAPRSPLGTTPVAVAFSPDGSYLYVTLAGLNAVEVFAVSNGKVAALPQEVRATFDGRTHTVQVPATYIPTGWYPDAMAVGPEPSGHGQRLYVANLRGGGSGPGFYGQVEPLVGSSTEGSVSAIDLPSDAKVLKAALRKWTTRVVNDDQLGPLYSSSFQDPATNPCLAAPLPNGTSIASDVICQASKGALNPQDLHVVIIEAENKTFDSYFGDTKAVLHNANADPLYTEYGQAVTTNQHQLAQTYSVDDNFWNEGAEASTLGHSWLSGSYTTLDRELTWGMDYSQNLRGQRSNGQYGAAPLSLSGSSDPQVNAQEQTMLDPRRLLIDEAQAKGLGVRLFGTDINPDSPTGAAGDQVPQNLWGEGGSGVSSDLAWPDVDRAAMFLHGKTISHAWDLLDGPTPPANFGKQIAFSPADYQKFTLDAWSASYQACVKAGGSDASCQPSMPNLTYMQLPENHTYVLSNVLNPLDPTPQSMVADNDYAIGQIVQGLSHSPFWKNTLVLVTEDDNQFTGDHVDIHRTFLLTAGGMARQLGTHGQVATQVGSFPSIDKTTEVLLGLKPLTLFDARAVPLHQVVADRTGASTSSFTATYPPTPFLSGRLDPLGLG